MKQCTILFIICFCSCNLSDAAIEITNGYGYFIEGSTSMNGIVNIDCGIVDGGAHHIRYDQRFIAYHVMPSHLYYIYYNGDTLVCDGRNRYYSIQKDYSITGTSMIRYFILDTKKMRKIEFCSEHDFDSVVNKLKLVPFEQERFYDSIGNRIH